MEIKLRYPLRALIQSALSGQYDDAQLRELHRLCFALARQAVRRKLQVGKLHLEIIGLSESDVTHDCIAELFTRTSENVLSEFAKFFAGLPTPLPELTDERLLVHIRRLVFSTVNDAVFRLYAEADPALARILRNIKIAVQRSGCWQLSTRFDEPFLELSGQSTRLPALDDDEARRMLTCAVREGENIPDILVRFARAVLGVAGCRISMHLTTCARTIRAAYIPPAEPGSQEEVPGLRAEEIRAALLEVSRDLMSELRHGYVVRGKVPEATFMRYGQALEHVLVSAFLGDREDGASYFESLQHVSPGMTREEYAEHHRAVFEYIVRQAKERVRETLKRQQF